MSHWIVILDKFKCARKTATNAGAHDLAEILGTIQTQGIALQNVDDTTREQGFHAGQGAAINTANAFAVDICDNENTANRMPEANDILTAINDLL